MFTKKSSLKATLVAFLAVSLLALSSCSLISNVFSNSDADSLEGTWVCSGSYGTDSYEITDKKVIYKYEGAYTSDYNYTIEYTIADFGDGYIYVSNEEKFYAISYKDLTETSVSLSNAYKETGKTSEDSLKAAKKEFTVENGYFEYYGTYTKQTN